MPNRWIAGLLAFSMLLTFTSCGKEESSADSVEESSAEGELVLKETELVQSDGTRRITIENGEFRVSDKEIWFNGANTPWDQWNDFGPNYDESFWDEHFAALHKAGVNATRVWVTCDGDAGIKIKADGTVTGAKDDHWAALDSMFALAAKHEVYIMATLMSFDHFKDTTQKHDRWRNMVSDPAIAQTYVDTYVIPFAKRYDSNDYLFSIDLCNEPDWIVENIECGTIGWDTLCRFFGSCAAAIHENSDILVTLGMGMIKYNSNEQEGNYAADKVLKTAADNENAYLDFYSTHFYEWQVANWGNAFTQSPTDYGLDDKHPTVMGECPAVGLEGAKMDLTTCVEAAYNNGWLGVFPWTSNGVDDCGGSEEVLASARHMYELIPDLIFPLGKD